MLNTDSRSRSLVGRIACVFGAARLRPRSRPPTMRISACFGESPSRIRSGMVAGSPIRTCASA